MKSRFTVLMICLALVCSFGLIGCESSEPSVQQKTESAMNFSYSDYMQMKKDNPAKAKAEYDGKIVKFHGYVENSNADYISVGEQYVKGKLANSLHVYLPTEVMTELDNGKEITVVGTFEYADGINVSKINEAEIVEE